MIPFFVWLWMIFQPQPVYQVQYQQLIDQPRPVVVGNIDMPRQVYFPPCIVQPGVTICP